MFVLIMVYVIDVLKGTERTSHFGETNNSQQKVESLTQVDNNQSKP